MALRRNVGNHFLFPPERIPALLSRIEQTGGLNGLKFHLVCDQFPTVFGEKSSFRRRSAQKLVGWLKERGSAHYKKYLQDHGVVAMSDYDSAEDDSSLTSAQNDNVLPPPPPPPPRTTTPPRPVPRRQSQSLTPTRRSRRESVSPAGSSRRGATSAAVESITNRGTGVETDPFIVVVNVDNPEKNPPFFFIQHVDYAENKAGVEYRAYDILICIRYVDVLLWEVYVPQRGGNVPVELEDRVVDVKAPAVSNLLKEACSMIENKEIKLGHRSDIECLATMEAIKDSPNRQFNYFRLVFPAGDVLNNTIFSSGNLLYRDVKNVTVKWRKGIEVSEAFLHYRIGIEGDGKQVQRRKMTEEELFEKLGLGSPTEPDLLQE